jgi:hypothetical protein
MAVYKVYILGGGGAEIIDHADTIEMGAGYYVDADALELAQSYARTGIFQATREGYTDVYATISSPTGYRERIESYRLPGADRILN